MNKRTIFLVLLCSCWLAGTTLWGQNVSIQAQLDRSQMKTGEQAVISMVIRTNDLANTRFRLSEEEGGAPQRFRILEFGATDTIDIDAQTKEIQAKMLITSFDSTLIVIPPIIVESPSGQAMTEPMALNIIQPEVDLEHPEDFKPIKDPWEVSWGIRDILALVLTHPLFWLILIALVAGYTYYRYKALPKVERSEPEVEPLPTITESPLECVVRELDAIEQAAYWRNNDYKTFYSLVIESLKRYIHSVKGWHVLEMTTSELNEYLYTKGEDKGLRTILERLQRDADLSKFAKSNPTESDARSSLVDARLFVEQSAKQWHTDERVGSQSERREA